MENSLKDLRLDIWRCLYDGMELSAVQELMEKKYPNVPTITIAVEISDICTKYFVAVEKQ